MSIAGLTNYNLITYVLPNELRSDRSNAMTNNLNMNNNKQIINLSTPTYNHDAATKIIAILTHYQLKVIVYY